MAISFHAPAPQDMRPSINPYAIEGEPPRYTTPALDDLARSVTVSQCPPPLSSSVHAWAAVTSGVGSVAVCRWCQVSHYIQQRVECMRCALAARTGTLFTRAYIQISYCAPSRNSFMSGRRPDSTNIYSFIGTFRDPASGQHWLALPEHFVRNGYNVGGSGHDLPARPACTACLPTLPAHLPASLPACVPVFAAGCCRRRHVQSD